MEGSGDNRALELYNGTGAAINLVTDGYCLVIHLDGQARQVISIPLGAGAAPDSIASQTVYIVAASNASGSLRSLAHQLWPGAFFSGDDAVVLHRGGCSGAASRVVDALGQVGLPPAGGEWGSGLTSTNNNTLRRQPTICAGDTNPDDPFDPARTWLGFPQDTITGLGSHSTTCPAASASTPALTAQLSK